MRYLLVTVCFNPQQILYSMFDLPTILYWFQLPIFMTGGLLLIFMSLLRDKKTYQIGIFLITIGLSVFIDMMGEFSSEFYTPLGETLYVILPMIITLIGYCFLVAFSYDMVISHGIIPKKFFLSWEILNIILACVCFVLPESTREDMYDVIVISQVLFQTLFLLHYPYVIYKHNKQIAEQYSNLESRVLYYQPYLVVFYMLVSEIDLFVDDILDATNFTSPLMVDIFFCLCALAWTIAVVYFAMRYKISENFFEVTADVQQEMTGATIIHTKSLVGTENIEVQNNKLDTTAETNKTSPVSQQVVDLFERLEQVMTQMEPFLQPDLTIAKIGEMITTHPKILSNCINSMTGGNFNHYVNKYRVDYVISLMKKKENDQLTIESIGQMAGFNNNATFYKAFKREYGMTPKQYYKQI